MHVRLDLDTVRANAESIQSMVDEPVVGVVKGVDARRTVVRTLLEAGLNTIAVSRVTHLAELSDSTAESMMLRIPGLSELPAVVERADVTLHSSIEVIEAADRLAHREGTIHRIIPMIDAGAAREGIPADRAAGVIEEIGTLDNIEIVELGINLGCFGERPDPGAVKDVARRFPTYPLSVGGSGMLLIRENLPENVSSFRFGDALFTGKWEGVSIDGLEAAAFQMGEVLTNRDGESVVDIGNVNSAPEHLRATETEIRRWSNELAVVDERIEVGELVPFQMEYQAMATAFNSKYG